MLASLCEYGGAATGILGAILASGPTNRSRRWGFAVWIVSDICLVVLSLMMTTYGMLGLYIFYLGAAGWGYYNNRRDPPA